MSAPFRHPLFRFLATFAAASCGGFAFDRLGFPAAWMSGALLSMAFLGFAGIIPVLPAALRDAGMLLTGILTGSAITPQMLEAVAQYPASLLVLIGTTLVIVMAGRWLMMRGFGWGEQTATFASVPGALSAVVIAVDQVGGDMLKVVVVQTFRLFILIGVLPAMVHFSAPPGSTPGSGTIDAWPFLATMMLALGLALIFEKIRLMAPFMFGGLVAAGALHLSGQVSGAPPSDIAHLAMMLIGIFAGLRFAGTSLTALRGLVWPGLSLFAVSLAVAVLGGLVAWRWLGIPLVQALVAYAPGGLEAMVLLGISMGLDPLYITSHHVARFVMLSLALPLYARLVADARP